MYSGAKENIVIDTAGEIADTVAERLFWRLKLVEYIDEIQSAEEKGDLQPLSEFLKENSP